MMRFKAFSLFINIYLLLPTVTHAQNLVPNGSFEATKGGHAYIVPLDSLLFPWFASTESAVFDDYYGPIASDSLLINESKLGNTFVVLDNYCGKTFEEELITCHGYLSTPLTKKLVKGNEYYFEMKVHVNKRSNRLVNGLGALFTIGRPKFDSCVIYNLEPQLFEVNVIPKLSGWYTISGTFVAEEDYAYLSLGIFKPDSLLNTVMIDADDSTYKDRLYTYFNSTRIILDDVKVFNLIKHNKYNVGTMSFATGQYKILSNFIPLLDSLYSLYKDDKYDLILIEGHTDDIGKVESNLLLSNNRANSIRDYFVEMGVPKEQIIAKGYGSQKPIIFNGPKDKGLNRRVEVQFLKLKFKE